MSAPSASLALGQTSSPIKRWQSIGYPVFAELIASDDELFLLRRFGTLNARIILKLQDDICRLEAGLKKLDEEYRKATEPVNNGSFRRDLKQDRKVLLEMIKEKLKEYNQFVVLHAELRSRPSVQKRQIQNIKNWHRRNPNAILPEEKDYINEEEDLMTIVPCLKTPLQRVLERTEWFSTSSCFRSKRKKNAAFNDPEAIFFQSEEKVRILDTTIVLVIGLFMLLTPIWVLGLLVKHTKARLGIISAFITLFLFGIQAVTAGKPGETLAATAAYSAVLMVFVQATTS